MNSLVNIEQLLKRLVRELQPYSGKLALCGGLASSLYRSQPRVTNDIDIAIDLGSDEASTRAAKKVLRSLGLVPSKGWIADSGGKLAAVAPLIIGRKSSADLHGTVDFLLPSFPWVGEAVRRAQYNPVNFGSFELPVISVEDLVVAKLFALDIEPRRFADLDDLQSIFKGKNELDLPYITAALIRLDVGVPRELEDIAPAALRRFRKRRG